MTMKIAIVGAGVIGMTTAITLLEYGFEVTLFSKDAPLETNSDAAIAAWFAPDESKPLLQQLCLETLPVLERYSNITASGVYRIPIIYFFDDEQHFNQSVFSNDLVRDYLQLTTIIPSDVIEHDEYCFRVMGNTFLTDTNIYRPFLLNQFHQAGGQLLRKHIDSLESLTSTFDITVNCTGWETTRLVNDDRAYPIRGQIEIANVAQTNGMQYSININSRGAYAIFRHASSDCAIGATYKINDASTQKSNLERKEIIDNLSPVLKEISTFKTKSVVGIRCGRDDVRLEQETVITPQLENRLIIHCYGHDGSGFSASWGSAARVLALICEH